MNTDEEIIKLALAYLKDNKEEFLKRYTKNFVSSENKRAFFTAGMSGAGKTELAISLKENDSNLLHIDTDNIREFFRPVGYDGSNSHLYQKASSRGYGRLFDYAIKQGYSLIMDSNLAYQNIAIQNIRRLLKRSYHIEIYYLYNDPVVCFEYTIRREIVTHRKVPQDVLLDTNIKSYHTVVEIKKIFGDKIILHYIDRRNENVYNDIEADFLTSLLGDEFDI